MWCLALAALGGCASLGAPPEQQVQVRAQERWDSLVKGDVKTAYGYLSPASRQLMDLANYESTLRKGFWKTAQVDKVICASELSCEVHVTIEYEFRGMRTKTPLRENWVKEGSNWWFVHR
jgi:hypothetical protein